MLAKRTRGNQITIPKEIVREAGLEDGDLYFDVVYDGGAIRLTPVEIKAKLPPEPHEKTLERALRREPGDILAVGQNARDALGKRPKKSRPVKWSESPDRL